MMPKEPQKRVWQKPWGYPESIAVVGGVLFVGLLLQLAVGQFEFYLLASPLNIYVGLVVALLCGVGGVMARRSSVVRWLCGVPFSVCLIVAFLLLTIIMGLTAQIELGQTLLGLDAMTRNWAFVLVYLMTMLSLGLLIARRLTLFKWRDCAFYLNHIGLWLLLAASGLGYADMERYIMHVQEGETEWRVYDDEKNVKELPLAIELNDFDMDVYPPKLAMIDRTTGDVLPLEKPHYFQLDKDMPYGQLNGWQIELQEYIHQAIRNSDSTYREISMPGASPAALVRATKNGESITGWICAGNRAQLYMTLPLDAEHSVVMTAAEPRSFTSDIEVYTQNGDTHKAILEVNSPLQVGQWTIYQYGYDNEAGRLSSYSSFELVYDPWMIPVYVGILMLLHGMGLMIYRGRNKRGGSNELE